MGYTHNDDYTRRSDKPANCSRVSASPLIIGSSPSFSRASIVAIGQVFPTSWDGLQFLYILAVLSVMLGVMNLLPIPALDGGHIVFCLFEMVTGRKPSDRFLMVAQMIGVFLLLALMFLAFGNDIARLIR